MTELEKKRILAKTMVKIEQEKDSENVQKKSNRWKMTGKVEAAALSVFPSKATRARHTIALL